MSPVYSFKRHDLLKTRKAREAAIPAVNLISGPSLLHSGKERRNLLAYCRPGKSSGVCYGLPSMKTLSYPRFPATCGYNSSHNLKGFPCCLNNKARSSRTAKGLLPHFKPSTTHGLASRPRTGLAANPGPTESRPNTRGQSL